MQNEQPVIKRQRLYTGLKSIFHFSHEIPLPQTVSIFAYSPKNESKKKKKLKDKFEKFTYYQDNETKQILKILFLTETTYIDQGTFPFTEPSGNVKLFSEIVNAKRLKVTEAAYIGHLKEQLIVKKIEGVKLGANGTEFQTVDDEFQLIKLGNEKRLAQFIKLMGMNPNSANMSIRVLVNEIQGQQPQVIDYEFFYRELELAKKLSGKGKNENKQEKK